MCECLTYADGDMYLCPPCVTIYQMDKAELERLRTRVAELERRCEVGGKLIQHAVAMRSMFVRLCIAADDAANKFDAALSAYRATSTAPGAGTETTKGSP